MPLTRGEKFENQLTAAVQKLEALEAKMSEGNAAYIKKLESERATLEAKIEALRQQVEKSDSAWNDRVRAAMLAESGEEEESEGKGMKVKEDEDEIEEEEEKGAEFICPAPGCQSPIEEGATSCKVCGAPIRWE